MARTAQHFVIWTMEGSDNEFRATFTQPFDARCFVDILQSEPRCDSFSHKYRDKVISIYDGSRRAYVNGGKSENKASK